MGIKRVMLNKVHCIISPSEHKFKGNDVSVVTTFGSGTGSRRKRQKYFAEKEVRITNRLEALCV